MRSSTAAQFQENMLGLQRTLTEQAKMDKKGVRILCIGRDPSLLNVRRLLLEQSGYAVQLARPNYLAFARPRPPIAVAVICHSVPEPVRTQTIAWIRQNLPQTRTLLLSQGYQSGNHMGYPISGTRPEELLKSIADLTGEGDPH